MVLGKVWEGSGEDMVGIGEDPWNARKEVRETEV